MNISQQAAPTTDIAMTQTTEKNPSYETLQAQLQTAIDQLTAASNTLTQTKPVSIQDKLKSRKFWISIIGAAIAMIGMITSGSNTAAIIAFVILEIVSMVGYFFAEGTVDVARTKQMVQMAAQITTMIAAVSSATGMITAPTDTAGMIMDNMNDAATDAAFGN